MLVMISSRFALTAGGVQYAVTVVVPEAIVVLVVVVIVLYWVSKGQEGGARKL